MKNAVEICLQDIVPFFSLHHKKKIVASDARVVYEKIDFPEFLKHLLERFFDRSAVRNVGFNGDRSALHRFDPAANTGKQLFVASQQCDIGSVSCRFERDCFANASRSACYNCNTIF